MSPELLRLIISAVATLLLAREASRAAAGSRRRLAFTLATGGFGLLALGNVLAMLGLGAPALLTLAIGVGLALLLGALVSLFLAYRDGELQSQFRRAGDMVAQERAKVAERAAEREERETTK